MKKISVIIPIFSTPAWVEICLDAINRSSIRKDIEVIAVMNTTDEQTINIVKKKNVDQMACLDKNVGMAAGFNNGAINASCDIVCLMHTDTFIGTNTFEQLLEKFQSLKEKNDRIVGVMPCTNYASEQVLLEDVLVRDNYVKYKLSTKSIPSISQIDKSLMAFYGNTDNCLVAIDEHSKKLAEENHGVHIHLPEISHYCLMLDKSTFIENGMFDPDFFPNGYFERLFLSKLIKNDLEIHLLKDVYVHHNGNTTSDFFGFSYKHSMELNRELYNRKCERLSDNENKIVKEVLVTHKKLRAKALVDQPAIISSDDPQRALFIRHGGLGDIIMTMPIVNDFRQKYPKCEIHYMCAKEFKQFVRGFTFLDNVIEADGMPSDDTWANMIEQNSDFYHLYDYVVDWTFYPELSKHAESLDRMEIFAQKYGIIENPTFPELEVKRTPKINEILNTIRAPYKILIAPQATCSCRTWNWHNVKSFCKFLKVKYGSELNIILVDKFSHDDMVDYNITNLCGRLNLEELIHLTNNVDALISTDTGLFHIAALLNKPCLGLFGSIPPNLRTKNYTNRMEFIYMKDVLKCIPCFDVGCNTVPCLNAIPNDLILEKLQKLIEVKL